MWIFDQSDGSARLLKSRCGHGAPPTKVRFCTKGGQGILSSGLDRSLRLFTTVKDSTATELSQGAWCVSTCGPSLHVVCQYMWSICTCDLSVHVVHLYMWSVSTCGPSVHVVHLYMWPIHACGPPLHVVCLYWLTEVESQRVISQMIS